MRSDEHFAAVAGDLFRCITGVFGQFQTLGPMIDRICGVRVADLNVENCADVRVGPVAAPSIRSLITNKRL